MDQALITRIIEAALLASSQPLTLAQLQGLFPEEEPAPPGSVERALELLREACAERGVELVEVASGFRFQVKADVHGWVARLWTERRTKYTRATLETLALIAYRQPITRGEIEQVRGVAVSSNIIQALEEREWIRVVGHRDVPGKPALFGTTKGFLDYFGLKRLDELPPLSELKDIAELEPQLPLDRDGQLDGAVPAAAAMDAARDQADADQADAEGGDTGADDADAGGTDADVEAGAAADDSGTGALQDSLEMDEADAERDTEIESDADADADQHAQQSPDDAAVDQQHHGLDEAIDTEAVDAVNDQTPQHPEHGSAHEKNTQDPDDAREGDPDTAPGTRADAVNEDEDNAVATTTVAVDEADSDPEADPQRGGRSQTHE
ncbi:SMC-Scp complex subunit ScpB [Xanthomonas euvesicatoria pv. eucalypti]|uniref:SMC-Scp complex subunit ScpB n=1 Tax=Xanthomonas euvesicatoria TaxID=456327 RepID=UPI0026E1F4AA|nr:SMC-Scp complex subunit ScpB [Xanthomonas euvesicatoria]MDO7932226.1 SMC-Scp complex subunit ScpB [Xanthomonas euvesicatoria pv. eucalypti]MDO7937254.1 SMC-Scp complex subunit ScpB [Xanthomonas euvesicatoria pv. eucalypti]MDO7941331.1 SMC-Scp complex subunit ScpB [Xanthomonas euvesicatoria pv. eucalypti]MDO7943677.1 SMC-Scp complex subunit ScpB [Xanthomonas euvesicatoria pv. eucalypti]MDO7949783.1 SMC-Scp complex subunit ScpB [Xanthomonas euvesicatoria pv. eucalypti]